jgi:outer membrane immunogenic protein
MKKLIAASSFLATLIAAAPAFAQAEPGSWTGPYAGVRLGYSFQPSDGDEEIDFDTNRDGSFNDTVRTLAGVDAFSPGFCGGLANAATPAGGCRGDKDAVEYAAHLGFDYQIGPSIVVGLVGEYGNSNINDRVSAFSTTPANYTMTRSLRGTGSVRARAGYAINNTLIYGTGGVAYGRVRNRFSTTNNANSFTNSNGSDARLKVDRDNVWGYTYGGGIEQRITDHFSIGALYLYTSLKDNDYRVDVGQGAAPLTNPFLLTNPAGTVMKRSHSELNRHSVSVTASYRF